MDLPPLDTLHGARREAGASWRPAALTHVCSGLAQAMAGVGAKLTVTAEQHSVCGLWTGQPGLERRPLTGVVSCCPQVWAQT